MVKGVTPFTPYVLMALAIVASSMPFLRMLSIPAWVNCVFVSPNNDKLPTPVVAIWVAYFFLSSADISLPVYVPPPCSYNCFTAA